MDKDKILEFYQEFFNHQNLSFAKQIIAEDYIQHNPGVNQGRQGLVEAFKKKFETEDYFQLEIDHILYDLPYVAVFVRSVTRDGETKANVVDLYRIENDQLVEHWDYFDKRGV